MRAVGWILRVTLSGVIFLAFLYLLGWDVGNPVNQNEQERAMSLGAVAGTTLCGLVVVVLALRGMKVSWRWWFAAAFVGAVGGRWTITALSYGANAGWFGRALGRGLVDGLIGGPAFIGIWALLGPDDDQQGAVEEGSGEEKDS